MCLVMSFVWRYFLCISIWIFSIQRSCNAAHVAENQANAQVTCFDHSKIYWKLHGDRDCTYKRTTSKKSPNKIHTNRQPVMVTHRFLSVSMKDTEGDVHCLHFEFDMKESFRNSITVALISGTERVSTTFWETSWTTGTRGFAWIPIQSLDCFQVELKVDHQAADDESIYIKNVVYHKSACTSPSKPNYSTSPALFTQKTTDPPTQAGISKCKKQSTEERFMSVTGKKSKPLLSRIKRDGSTSHSYVSRSESPDYSDVSETGSSPYTNAIPSPEFDTNSPLSSIDIASDSLSSAAHNASYSPSSPTYITTDSLSSSKDITSNSQSSTPDFTSYSLSSTSDSPSSASDTTSDSPSATSDTAAYSPSSTNDATSVFTSKTNDTTSDSPSSTTETTSYSPSSTNDVTSVSPSSTNGITSDSSSTNDIPSDFPSSTKHTISDSPSSTNYITSTLPSSTIGTASDTLSPGASVSSSSVSHTSAYSTYLGSEMETYSSSLTTSTDLYNSTLARGITNETTLVENNTQTHRSLTTSFGSPNGHSTSSTSIIVGSVAAGIVAAVLGLVLIRRWKQCHCIKRTGNEMNCGHSLATSVSMTTDGDPENAEAEISDQTDMLESPYITFHNYEEVKPLSEICAPSTSLTTENASMYAAVVKQRKGGENLITQNPRTVVDCVANNISENSSYPHHSATSSRDEYMRIDFQASAAVQPQSDLYDHVKISNPFPPSSVSDGRSNQQQHPGTSPGEEYMRIGFQAATPVQIHSNVYDHVETHVRYPQEQKETGLYFVLEEQDPSCVSGEVNDIDSGDKFGHNDK